MNASLIQSLVLLMEFKHHFFRPFSRTNTISFHGQIILILKLN